MRKSRNQIFVEQPHLEEEMFALRREGWSFTRLASHYSIDKKAIHKRCVKAGVFSLVAKPRKIEPQPVKRIIRRLNKQTYFIDQFGDKINKGHSYKYYLKLSTRHDEDGVKS